MLEVFSLAAELAIKDGVAPLCRLPGVWERQIDDNWKIVLNGHNSPKDGNGLTIPPFHMSWPPKKRCENCAYGIVDKTINSVRPVINRIEVIL